MKKILLVVIIIPFIICSGCTQTIVTTDIDYIVTPTGVQNANYNEATSEFTVLVKSSDGSLIDYRKPTMSFLFVPRLEEIRDKDDYAYLFFSAENYEKRLFKDSDGVYQLKWADDSGEIWLMSGEKRITLEDTVTLTLTLDLNPFQLIELESSSLDLVFSNLDNTWSQSYVVNFIGVEV